LHCIFATKILKMKKWQGIFALIFVFTVCSANLSDAQCSICTKTASQLGEKPAQGLNSGIVYLMVAPLAIASVIGFRWWKREQTILKDESSD
jgi:hypothetical protein